MFIQNLRHKKNQNKIVKELTLKLATEKRKSKPHENMPLRSGGHKWLLQLYVAGQTRKAITALNNLKIICEEQLKDNYKIEVIDLIKNPQLARQNQIFAVPTLKRKIPQPVRNIIGDLSNTENVLKGLDLKTNFQKTKG